MIEVFGSSEYVKQWPVGLLLRALGHCLHIFGIQVGSMMELWVIVPSMVSGRLKSGAPLKLNIFSTDVLVEVLTCGPKYEQQSLYFQCSKRVYPKEPRASS